MFETEEENTKRGGEGDMKTEAETEVMAVTRNRFSPRASGGGVSLPTTWLGITGLWKHKRIKFVAWSHRVCGNLFWLPRKTVPSPEHGLKCLHLQKTKGELCLPLGLSSLIMANPQSENPGCSEGRVQAKFLGLQGSGSKWVSVRA